jgi:soluble lytic murein transglycosylase-like protein
MGLVSTLAFGVALATTRIILEREDMLSEGLSAFGVAILSLVAYLVYREYDAGGGEATGPPVTNPPTPEPTFPDLPFFDLPPSNPTPPSDPSTTLSGPASVERWINEASRAANLTGVPRDLILAVIWQESTGDPNAVGSAGEQGLMQVTEIAAQDVGEILPTTDDPPQRQITVGAKYLSKCGDYVGGDTKQQLRCYNEGPPPLTAPASETYAEQVLAKRRKLRNG